MGQEGREKEGGKGDATEENWRRFLSRLACGGERKEERKPWEICREGETKTTRENTFQGFHFFRETRTGNDTKNDRNSPSVLFVFLSC